MGEPYNDGPVICVLCGRVTMDPVYGVARGPSCRSHDDDNRPRKTTDAQRYAMMDRMIAQADADEAADAIPEADAGSTSATQDPGR